MVQSLVSRLRVVALVAALAMIIAACGSDEPAAEPAPEPAPEPEAAEEPEPEEPAAPEHDYQDGDVIRLVLGTSPGGGFDFATQAIEGPWQEQIRELTGANVTIQREYLPGGAHLVAMQHLAGSEPDGRTVQYLAIDTAVGHIAVGGEDVNYLDWSHIGGVNRVGRGFLARASLIDDVGGDLTFANLAEYSQQQSILIGHTGGREDTEMMFGLMAEEGLPINVDYVQYDGTSVMTTALIRGEIDLSVANTAAFLPAVQDNPDDLVFMVHMGCERSPDPDLADVPSIMEENPPGASVACELFQTSTRIVTAPAGTHEGNLAVLVQALENVLTDPDFIEEFMDFTGTDAVWLSPAEVDRVSRAMIEAYESYMHLITS